MPPSGLATRYFLYHHMAPLYQLSYKLTMNLLINIHKIKDPCATFGAVLRPE